MTNSTTGTTQPQALRRDHDGFDLSRFVGTRPAQMGALAVVCLIFTIIAMLYFLNLIHWARSPDFGWSAGTEVSEVKIWSVHGPAQEAGLRVGDRIVGVNNKKGNTLLQLQQYADRQIPGRNVYDLEREGKRLRITVPNEALGFSKAFLHFGITWLVGIVFFLFGAIVFFMKPGTHPSWGFLVAMFIAGLHIIFLNVSKLSPAWLGHVHSLTAAFQAAPILHLALMFPEELPWVRRRRWLFVGTPYVVSLGLFAAMYSSAPQFTEVPQLWKEVYIFYLIAALCVLAGFTLFAAIKSDSVIVRARSRVILFGLLLGVGPPTLDGVVRLFLRQNLIPHPVFYLFFSILLPLSIAYSIVKHNLFDVDVYVKRAVGYGIMTALVAASYFALQTVLSTFVLEPLLGASAQQAYPIIFAVLVVFLFSPINSRVQGLVDKVFFRKAFDYKEAVLAVERALTSVLDLKEIITRIVQAAREHMFIDSAGVIVLERDKEQCLPFFMGDDEPGTTKDQSSDVPILPSDPLISLVDREKKFITRYDIEEDPRYRQVREPCRARFAEWGASIALPLLFQNEVIGVLLVGYKKSGKFYNREDIELLETLSAHGAVAIENARLAERMQQEEVLRANLSRYASPQVVEQIVRGHVEVNLGGQRKWVTVLFSDIRGFTGITGTRPPDQLMQLLNEYFGEMGDIIFDHQGSVEQYVGDAIMAVFGSLVEVENPAENAVRAAIQMMERMPALSARWEEKYGFTLATGVGLTTGEVLFGNIGSSGRMELAVIGETVIMASRFSGLAKAGQILAAKETVKSLGPPIRYQELPRTPVKGKAEEVEVFEILYRARGSRGSDQEGQAKAPGPSFSA